LVTGNEPSAYDANVVVIRARGSKAFRGLS
jgi:hypothetical protein